MNGADQTSHKWVPSDQLIGQNYQPNIDDSTVNHLKEELQQMELYTHDAEEWRESEELSGHQLKKSPTKRRDCHSDQPRGAWSSEMWDDRSSRRPRDQLLGCDQSWSYSELRNNSSQRQPNQVSGGHWENSFGQQQDWDVGERHLSVAGHGHSSKQHQDNHSPKMTPPKRARFKQSANDQQNRFRSDDCDWSREMPAGDCNVNKTYQAAYQSSANDLSGDEHHQYGRRARKSKWHKQQSGSSDSEHKDSPPLQSNEAGRADRGDGGRQESGSRYGPRAGGRQARNSGHDDSLQNDYLWHRRKVDKRARAILSELNPDRLHETVEAFDLVIYPGDRKLADLPGPKELHICVEAIFMYAVDHPEHLNAITALLASFSEEASIFVTMVECLPTLMDNFVRETTNVVLQRQRNVFLQLLGLLYTECHLWNTPAADPIINCVTQYFEKWCMYTNKSGSAVDPLQSAYLDSLDALLQTAGPALEEHFPAKLTAGFTQLSSKIIDTTIDVSLRLQIAVLMVKRVRGWSIPGHEQRHTSSSAVQCMTASEHKQVQVQPEELDPLHLAPELLSSSTQTTVAPLDVHDPYCRVRRMLQTLNMEELLDIFHCNAIRDSLLDMPFQDLKELLREVDIKPGYVWEIKSYLENCGQLPLSPVQRSSPNSVRSCYTDQTDPELNEINERSNNPKNPRPFSRNTGAAASKLSARFIPPHRLTLLTPSNFMAGNSETVADHIQMVTSPSEYATEKDDMGVFMKNNEPANADYASSDDEPNTSAEKNFPPCNFTTALVTEESEVSCNEQSAVTTNNGNRYYPPHSIAGYQSQKHCDYSLPQAIYSNTASQRKSEYPPYLVSNGGAQNLKMIPARADQDTNWRVKSRQGPTNIAANRDEG